MNYVDTFIKDLQSIDHNKKFYDLYNDFITLTGYSLILNTMNFIGMIPNRNLLDKNTTIYNKYTKEQLKIMGKCIDYIYENNKKNKYSDFLGQVFSQSECINKGTGQFFTPDNLSKLTANLVLKDIDTELLPIEIHEPSIGGGSMVLQSVKALNEKYITNDNVFVIGNDIDEKSILMAYIQLSINDIPARLIQTNTLTDPNGLNTNLDIFTYAYFKYNMEGRLEIKRMNEANNIFNIEEIAIRLHDIKNNLWDQSNFMEANI